MTNFCRKFLGSAPRIYPLRACTKTRLRAYEVSEGYSSSVCDITEPAVDWPSVSLVLLKRGGGYPEPCSCQRSTSGRWPRKSSSGPSRPAAQAAESQGAVVNGRAASAKIGLIAWLEPSPAPSLSRGVRLLLSATPSSVFFQMQLSTRDTSPVASTTLLSQKKGRYVSKRLPVQLELLKRGRKPKEERRQEYSTYYASSPFPNVSKSVICIKHGGTQKPALLSAASSRGDRSFRSMHAMGSFCWPSRTR